MTVNPEVAGPSKGRGPHSTVGLRGHRKKLRKIE